MEFELIDKFNFASDTIKQILGISSGILALTVTFAKEQIVKGRHSVMLPLQISWGLEILSLFAGIWALIQITSQVVSENLCQQPSVWASGITVSASLQIFFFLFAMLFLALAGIKSFKV